MYTHGFASDRPRRVVFPRDLYNILVESGLRALSLQRLCSSRAYAFDQPAFVAGCLWPGTRHRDLLVGVQYRYLYYAV